MRQARWTEKGVEVAEVTPGPLAPGYVRLSVSACGICGTDLHLYRRELPALPGGVPGHEVCGTVLDGPADLRDALYAVEPRVWCGACDLCASGDRHLCASGAIFGVERAGGLADFMDVPRESLHAVAAHIGAAVASLSEPLAVCVRAVQLARPEPDSRVLVLGAGTIGLLSGLLARDRAGGGEVAITARHPHQREAAKRLGLVPLDPDEVAPWASSSDPDVIIETVGGHADTLDEAVRLCRRAGRIAVLGVFSRPTPLSALALMAKELTIRGSNTYGTGRRGPEFRAAVELLPRYRSELEPLLTHAFPLESLEEAFACAEDKRSGAIKVSLLPDRAPAPGSGA